MVLVKVASARGKALGLTADYRIRKTLVNKQAKTFMIEFDITMVAQ